jgi:hypothetical protein
LDDLLATSQDNHEFMKVLKILSDDELKPMVVEYEELLRNMKD